jgi:K+-transporting ATPase ATPase B chain
MKNANNNGLFSGSMLRTAIAHAFVKLNPAYLIKNPVMFCVAVVSLITTFIAIHDAYTTTLTKTLFNGQIALWLWFTVLFANFAESLAESKGKAQVDALRQLKTNIQAKKLLRADTFDFQLISPELLLLGDLVLVRAGDLIPADGEVIAGIATVDESAITGESEPVIRDSSADRSAVTAGTKVTSDWIKIKVSVAAGHSFLDRMIRLIEGAKRQKAPNEIALTIILAGFTLIFIVATGTIEAFASYAGITIEACLLIALFVTLIPTTIAGLLSAIGISGMQRLIRFNVLAKSGKAVEAAGDIDTLLLDKTGTITLGNRHAIDFMPLPNVDIKEIAKIALLSSLSDDTPEGRSIVALAQARYHLISDTNEMADAKLVPFSAYTRLSGVNIGNQEIRKGAVAAIINFVISKGGAIPQTLNEMADNIAKQGSTPLAVAIDDKILGIIHLKDIIKSGIRERFQELRRMGIRSVMITGDNPLTAAAIAAEAGIDDFIAQATPETKLNFIKDEQAKGKMVAMCGDGTNDAPALAQADVGLAMASGTAAAREAGNMVDLESDPTKLIEVIKIGKQMLMTRGALTTFSITNDIAKYFAIIPAMFVTGYPQLAALNIMHLTSPQSAILSAIIFNAIIIILLIPMALRGVRYRITSATNVLKKNLALFSITGILIPFIGIKLIDIIISHLGIV